MTSTIGIEFLVALAIPLALLIFLRVNAALVFLSLCLGYVLVRFVADDADSLINFLAPNKTSLSASALRLGMLFAPAVATTFIMVFSVKGKIRTFLNILPAIGATLLAALFAVPLLTPGMQTSIDAEPFWLQITRAQSLLIGCSALISLFLLWTQRRSARMHEHDKRRH